MAWVESESFGLCCPCLGDELAWRETFKGLQSSGEVVSVDEDQSRGLDPLLMLLPADAMALYVRAIPFARDDRLFLSVTPMQRKKRLIIDVSALTPRSASSRSHSA
jgi:hypothetical protein